MAKQNIIDFKGMSQEELLQYVKGEKLRLQRMTFNHSVTPMENPTQIKALRRDIARAKTEMRARQLAALK
ncbi:MAG: 50S ribosomal protein L29 [Sphingobacteriales bacterium]|nr:50S ribosomal protein L29 [Sphingobacteriales bacterium]